MMYARVSFHSSLCLHMDHGHLFDWCSTGMKIIARAKQRASLGIHAAYLHMVTQVMRTHTPYDTLAKPYFVRMIG